MTDGALHQFYCERCESYVAPDAVVTIAAADGRVRIPGCPTCRGHVRREDQEVRRPFDRLVFTDAIAPIFRARNAHLLVATTFVGFFLWRFVPGLGLLVSGHPGARAPTRAGDRRMSFHFAQEAWSRPPIHLFSRLPISICARRRCARGTTPVRARHGSRSRSAASRSSSERNVTPRCAKWRMRATS